MVDGYDVEELPEMLPGETRAEWVERIRTTFERPPAPPASTSLDVPPYDPEKWDGIRKPYREGA